MATLDPIVTLQVAGSIGHSTSELGAKGKLSSVTSVCFIANRNSGQQERDSSSLHADDDASDGAAVRESNDDDDSSGSDDDEDGSEPIRFECDRLTQEEQGRIVSRRAPSVVLLSHRHLVSCHADGTSYLWDLERQRIAQEFVPPRGGPGLLVRRTTDDGGGGHNNDEENSRLIYQTRDPNGTVSCHRLDAGSNTAVQEIDKFETHSQTFCAAAPCHGNRHLIALPTHDDTTAVVRDWRVSPSSRPVAAIHTFAAAPAPGTTSQSRYGMLTSLALTEIEISGSGGARMNRPMLACGLESGHVLWYDLAMAGTSPCEISEPHSLLALDKDPVLTLDMVSSKLPESSSSLGSLVTIAGLAGSSDDLATLPESEQGRVAILKATLVADQRAWHCRLRARLATCRILNSSDSMPTIAGKPGVSICRFRPDGQLFAVAGWDKRVRIFDRTVSSIRDDHSVPRALLRGHSTSVTAFDWAPDAVHSGLLATGGNDGRINVWNCFGSSTNSNP